ncbi:MAG: hemolysin III family protein [Bacilli bacterium]|nr:hemolysin III family protein [Bacilli bacterium]
MTEKNSLPKYTLGEELVNSISHGVGAALAIAGLVLLIIRAHSALGVVCGVIYGVIMIVLYTISCIYHALSPKLKGKRVLRTLDHINVLLMVAGTYTPISLCLLGGATGWISFSVVWVVTIIAVVFNAINVNQFQFLSIASNLLLGWGAILIFGPLMRACPMNGIILLVSGGIVYTIGAILYGVGKKIPYIHSLFHFFVLGASILHYFLIYFYIV